MRDSLLHRFGEFARSSAPSAAFAVTVASMAMMAAPASASAGILLGSTVGMGGTKLGLGGASASAGTALGSLTAAAGQHPLLASEIDLGMILAAALGGSLGSYLGGRYLMSFAESPDERGRIRRFVHVNTLTAMAVCVGMLLLTVLGAPEWVQLLGFTAGMGGVCWQCLVPLQRIMQPLIARDAARRGRTGRNWRYEALYGRTGMLVAFAGMLAVVLWVAQ